MMIIIINDDDNNNNNNTDSNNYGNNYNNNCSWLIIILHALCICMQHFLYATPILLYRYGSQMTKCQMTKCKRKYMNVWCILS